MGLYEAYGLTKELAIAKGIRPIEYVAIESPRFAEEVSVILPELKNLITKQELVWTLTIESTYEQRRRWSEFLAIREILQNALDTEHEAVGYDNIAVKVQKDKLGTWIIDRGKGITYKAFMLGGEEKPCEMRGAYGEGLKIALLWFSSRGYPLFIFTRGAVVFSCYYSTLADALVIVMGRSVHDTRGTKALILGYDLSDEVLGTIYYKAAKMNVVCKTPYASPNCKKDMPNLILEPRGLLFVRDIHVNTFMSIVNNPSYFSYNLWWLELEPNRIMINSAWRLQREVGRLLGQCLATRRMIMDNLVEEEMLGVKFLKVKDDFYEAKADYSEVAPIVLDAIHKSLVSVGVTAYSTYGDLDGVTAVAHEGGKCLLVRESMLPLFARLPKASEFVIKTLQTLVEGATPLDERSLNAYGRGHLQIWRMWVNSIVKGVKIQVVSGDRSFYRDDLKTIFMTKEALEYMKDHSAIHEIAHAYGYKKYGTALHYTEHFEDALAIVAREIYYLVTTHQVSAAIDRCNQGGIFAEEKTLSDYFGELKDKLTDGMKNQLFLNPTMFVILAPFGGGWTAVTSSGILAYEPVVEERYDKLVKERGESLREIRDWYMKKEIDNLEAAKQLEAAHLSTALVQIFDSEYLEIYVYSLLMDKYKWVGRIK